MHSAAPKHISFLAFCSVNVLVDVEPLYFMLTHQYPIHRIGELHEGQERADDFERQIKQALRSN